MTHDSANDDAMTDAPRLEAGFRVGDKYVITQLLGVGANGAVYEATHEAIGHRVAIKVVHQALATRDDVIERFRREAKVCGTIRDRHVGQVYDVGQLPDGAPYMVMELQEGKPLEDLLKRKTLPIATVVDVGRQLLAGLTAAHAADVVHRDIKPGNLMLNRERNGEHLVKLVDFGISKRVTRDITERNVTVEGTVVGSPDYMPPEQLRGGDVDQRADIYATGVLLYEAVTGRMPFDAPSLTELLAAILRDPVTPPHQLRPDCPPELDALIMRALSRDRAARFQSATEMNHALAQIVQAHGLAEGSKAWDIESFPQAGSASKMGALSKTAAGVDYAIETERVRTVELQVPKKKLGPTSAAIGAALAVGVIAIIMLSADDESDKARADDTSHAITGAIIDAPRPSAIDNAIDLDPRAASGAEPTRAEPTPVEATPVEPSVEADAEEAPTEPSQAATLNANTQRTKTGASDATRPTKSAAGASAADGKEPSRTNAATRRTAEAAAVDVGAVVTQASSAFVQGQLPKALALYQQAVNAAPNHAAAWRGLGMTAMKMGRNTDARRAFERYLKLAPTASDAARIQQKLSEL